MAQNNHLQNKVSWDSWFIEHTGKSHVFYLQAERADNGEQHGEVVSIGHAVSDNLVDWEELSTALEPGKEDGWDDLAL